MGIFTIMTIKLKYADIYPESRNFNNEINTSVLAYNNFHSASIKL